MAADCSLDWASFLCLLVHQLGRVPAVLLRVGTIVECRTTCLQFSRGEKQVHIIYQMVFETWKKNKAEKEWGVCVGQK